MIELVRGLIESLLVSQCRAKYALVVVTARINSTGERLRSVNRVIAASVAK